jgi:hypothetical protein
MDVLQHVVLFRLLMEHCKRFQRRQPRLPARSSSVSEAAMKRSTYSSVSFGEGITASPLRFEQRAAAVFQVGRNE